MLYCGKKCKQKKKLHYKTETVNYKIIMYFILHNEHPAPSKMMKNYQKVMVYELENGANKKHSFKLSCSSVDREIQML